MPSQLKSPQLKSRAPISQWIAHLLDDFIKIPGTNKRIGLDPIIGLIPGFGDFAISTAGLTLIATGIQRKVHKSVYLRMIANWTLNALIGAIPILGDLFSFWYKSNQRNHRLLRAHLDETPRNQGKRAGWAPVIILLIIVLCVFSLIGLAAFYGGKLIRSLL